MTNLINTIQNADLDGMTIDQLKELQAALAELTLSVETEIEIAEQDAQAEAQAEAEEAATEIAELEAEAAKLRTQAEQLNDKFNKDNGTNYSILTEKTQKPFDTTDTDLMNEYKEDLENEISGYEEEIEELTNALKAA